MADHELGDRPFAPPSRTGDGVGGGVEEGVLDTVPDAEAIVTNKTAVAFALRHLTI